MTREEEFYAAILAAINGDDHTCPTPVWRIEEFLKAIHDAIASGGGSSGGGVLVAHETVSGTTHTLDKTWQEIHDALAQGIPCVTVHTDRNNVEQGQIVLVSGIPGNYYVSVLSAQVTTPVVVKWTATSADGYPSLSTGSGTA